MSKYTEKRNKLAKRFRAIERYVGGRTTRVLMLELGFKGKWQKTSVETKRLVQAALLEAGFTKDKHNNWLYPIQSKRNGYAIQFGATNRSGGASYEIVVKAESEKMALIICGMYIDQNTDIEEIFTDIDIESVNIFEHTDKVCLHMENGVVHEFKW